MAARLDALGNALLRRFRGQIAVRLKPHLGGAEVDVLGLSGALGLLFGGPATLRLVFASGASRRVAQEGLAIDVVTRVRPTRRGVRGSVVFETPRSRLVLDADLTARGEILRATVTGTLAIEDALKWSGAKDTAADGAILAIDAAISGTLRRFTWTATAKADGATIDAEGDDAGQIRLEASDAGVLAKRIAFAHVRMAGVPPALFDAIDVRGELWIDAAHALRGAVVVEKPRTEIALRPEGATLSFTHARVDLTIGGTLATPSVHGRGRTELVHFARPGVSLRDLTIDASLSPSGITVHAATARGVGSESFPLPADLKLQAALTVGFDGALDGGVTLETPTSRLVLRARLANGSNLAGSALIGHLSFADARTCRIFSGRVAPRPVGVIEGELAITGTLTSPALSGRVLSPRVLLGSASPALPLFVLDDVTALLRVDTERLAWQRLDARVYDGTLSTSGVIAYGAGFSGLQAQIDWHDLAIDRIPTRSTGASDLAGKIRGKLTGALRVQRSVEGLTCTGTAALDEAEYALLHATEPSLAAFGLPVPDVRGRGPLTVHVQTTDSGLLVREIAGRLQGIAAIGDVTLAWDGGLSGNILAHLHESYLRQSVLLAIPAAFAGDVTIPIRIGGHVSHPRFDADLVGVLSGLLAHNRLGCAVMGALDGIARAFDIDGTRAPIAEDAMVAMLDRILEGGDDADPLIERLVESGIDSYEIVRRLEARRRQISR